jgi:mannose-1-phosphate guanylyltransferase / mannose-6-phosphate isomerase
MTDLIVPVILCGGSGTRLWPASREHHPKQFLKLMGEFSLLQETARRAMRITGAPATNIVTVTLGKLGGEVRKQMEFIDDDAANHILNEPSARNTAAAVAFAASYVKEQFGPKAMMWVLPADHHMGDENALRFAFQHGMGAARKNHLVTFGIAPTRPETGYGYIRTGDALMGDAVLDAEEFVEKPDLATAQTYIDSGDYLWNSGMFLFSAQSVLKEFERHAPEILDGVKIATHGMKPGEAETEFYNEIVEMPFDKAIMERSPLVAVVPCNPSWSDIGSWESLWEIRNKDKNGNALDGRVAAYSTRNSFIQGKDRLIACAGLENIVIVDTGDAILIADRANSDAMKTMVKGLKKAGAAEVVQPPPGVQHSEMSAPVENPGDYSVRELTVHPGEKLTLSGHEHHSIFWTVLEGQAVVTIGGSKKQIRNEESIFIPSAVDYSLANTSNNELKIVEVCRMEKAKAKVLAFGKKAAAA